MSISATSSKSAYTPPATTLLTVLAQSASLAVQQAQQREVALVTTQINNRLNAQVAALQSQGDTALTTALQSQITALQNQQAGISKLSTQYGGNATILSDLQNQIATMQTAAANGDSGGFDTALGAANTDVSNLVVVTPQAQFQPDRVNGLKGTGLGIASSATYDLSTPTGQAAAATALQSAQFLVGLIFQATNSNHLLTVTVARSLGSQITGLNSQLSQLSQANSAQTSAQIANLQQLAQDQEHVIELALGNTQLVSSVLSTLQNPPQPVNSVFGALEGAVGATPATYNTLVTTPPILSLLT